MRNPFPLLRLVSRMTPPDCLICPLCAGAFEFQPQTWRCVQGHSFDVAREGYVNLLPVQHKHSRDPGDRPESLLARRAFLEAGHYAPLREALVRMLDPLQPRTVVDVGAGEGWYTSALRQAGRAVIGVDIAKPAVKMAAKRCPDITWIVGSGARLPLATAGIDALCSLFTPLHEVELARVLAPGGQVIIATPGVEHLHSLRAALFETVEAHDPDKFQRGFRSQFTLAERCEVCVPLDLDGSALRHLAAMTPYAWKARPERRAALERLPGLRTEAQFVLMRFVRNAATEADATEVRESARSAST